MGGTVDLGVYSAVMKVYAAGRLFHKTCDLYPKVLEDSLVPDTVMYGCLIKASVEAGRLDLSRDLYRKSGTQDIQNFMSLFRACGRERNVPKVLGLLTELEESDIPVDTTAYNCVLDVCVSCGDMAAASNLLEKMKASGYVDVISFNTLLKGAAKGRTVPSDILKDMRGLNLKPNQVTYNSLINAAISCGNTTAAWNFVEEMETENVAIDNFTCSIMMKTLKYGNDGIDKTLALIERVNVVPDEVLLNTLLDACVRLRDTNRLTKALEILQSKGVVPSEKAYGTLIRAYGHARCLDQAWSMWRDMLARKVKPSEQTFTSMVEACASNGAVEDAVRVFAELKKNIPDYTTTRDVYTPMIRGFAQRRETQQCLKIYDEMKANRVPCSLVIFNSLIDACARVGNTERASEIFRDMCAQGVTPDLITYSTVIKAYCVQGDLEQGVQLFTLMRRRGVTPDAILFNSLLDGCARKQMRALAEQVFDDMVSSGVTISASTLCILVKLYGACHDVEKAFEVVNEIAVKHGVTTNAQLRTCLLSTCASNGYITEALELFAKIESPDAKTYTTLINGCLKNNHVAEALDLVGEAVPRTTLDKELVTNVVFMAQRRGIEGVQPVARHLRAAGYTVAWCR